MPKPRTKELIVCPYFKWVVGPRNNGVYYADGRSNDVNLGRHSLDTKDRSTALDVLKQLDLVKAVDTGRADKALLERGPATLLKLADGRKQYLDYVGRAPALGGAEVAPGRYQAVFDKFIPFAQKSGVYDWNSLTANLVERYCTWLDDNDYAMATIYLEATTIKQVMKWLAKRKLIPQACIFELQVERPEDSDAYCYKRQEVEAILKRCFNDPTLHWLGHVILFLCTTGLRISELVQLRWSDIDFDANIIRLPDRRRRARKSERASARGTKGRRGRILPLHPDLRQVLETMPRAADGLILHAAKGGTLDDDKIRKVLIRDVLDPLGSKMPTPPEGEKGFRDGRLHSFRHYFVSVCASDGIPIQVLMSWMGHRDSKMIKYYYHLHAEESQKQIKRIQPAGGADAAWRPRLPQSDNPNERSAPGQNDRP